MLSRNVQTSFKTSAWVNVDGLFCISRSEIHLSLYSSTIVRVLLTEFGCKDIKCIAYDLAVRNLLTFSASGISDFRHDKDWAFEPFKKLSIVWDVCFIAAQHTVCVLLSDCHIQRYGQVRLTLVCVHKASVVIVDF